MIKRWLLIILIGLLVLAPLTTGCSGDDSTAPEQQEEPEPQEETAADEEADDDPGEEEENAAGEDEVLFDFYSTPSDWPRAVPPVMNEFKVTSYERTDNTMYAAGFGDLQMSRANNFYTNATRDAGNSFDWTFDPGKESVTEGSEQVFYYIDEAGKSLTIKLKEIDPMKIEFELDYQE